FRLAFATATPHGLTSPPTTSSQAHSSKGTPSPLKAPTDCKHTVSGTISLPSRGAFHLSLTVLVRYRSQGSIQAYQVVLADSHRISRARCYPGASSRHGTVSPRGVPPPRPAPARPPPLTPRDFAALAHKVAVRPPTWSSQIHPGSHGPGATRQHHHAL